MYIAMNRFKVKIGSEEDFIHIWKNRKSFLDTSPGYIRFSLLQGPSTDEETLFASHTEWESEADFTQWINSEAFAKAHAGAGAKSKDIYLGPPKFEGFNSID